MPIGIESKPLVILLAYYFPPSTEIGAARPSRFYKYLKSAGYDCRVVTATPQPSPAPPDVIAVPDRMADVWHGHAKFKPGFRAISEVLIRKWLLPGSLGLSWAVDASTVCARLIKEAGRRAVLISSYPPDGVLIGGLMAAKRHKVTWIADFRDPLSFGLGLHMHESLTRRVRIRMESVSLRASAAIIANTRSMGEEWRKKLGPAGDKVHVIWNGFDANDRPSAAPLARTDCIQIAHVGALYHGRNPNLILASLDRLRRRGAAEALRTRFLLVGPIGSGAEVDEALTNRGIAEGWLEMRGAVGKQEAQAIAASAHAQVLLQPGSAVQVPGKLFEQICVGRPIVAVTPRASEAEYILQNCGVPYACLYEDDPADAIDENLLRFLRIPPDPVPFNGWFEQNFEMRNQGAQLASVIASVT